MRLLAAVAAVIRQPRAAIRAPARSRKPSSAPGRSAQAGAGHPGGERERGLQRAARAERERFAAHQQGEPGGQGGEQGQAHRRGGDQAGPGRVAVTRTSRARTGRPRRAKTFQIPDTKVYST